MNGRIIKQNNQNRISIIGKIKVGEKKTITNKRGEKVEIPLGLDYFRAVGKYSCTFHSVLGDRPDIIKIIFVSDNAKDVCYERFEYRNGKKLYASSDGENFEVFSEKTNEYENYTIYDRPNIENEIEQKYKTNKSRILTLRFLLPDLRGNYGLWQFDTKSENSINQIISTFDTIQKHAGTIIQIPFDLIVEKVTSQNPGNNYSFPIVKMICNLSQPSLECVKNFIDSGKELSGMLTEDKINNYLLE